MTEQYDLIRERFLDDAAPRLTSKYMISTPVRFTGKTWVYEITSRSNYQTLGVVKWYGPWRQYCFHPEQETMFNQTCLAEITQFLKDLKEERRVKSDKHRTEVKE